MLFALVLGEALVVAKENALALKQSFTGILPIGLNLLLLAWLFAVYWSKIKCDASANNGKNAYAACLRLQTWKKNKLPQATGL